MCDEVAFLCLCFALSICFSRPPISFPIEATTFEKECERAVEEAELMAAVHRDIFNKDTVVSVYGVAMGVLPAHLLGLGLGVAADEECVAIIMRLETGGSLESWLHEPMRAAAGGTGMLARTTGERLYMAMEVAGGALATCMQLSASAKPFFFYNFLAVLDNFRFFQL